MSDVQTIGRSAVRPHASTILLVEDEILISEFVARALEDLGFKVHVAASAKEALRHIESGAAVDALFTDVNLPGGMDGSELAARVRALRPELPIVYASGRWTPNEQAPLVPRSVFLAKPYDPRDAGNLLKRLVATPH
ncbi:MAG TPA: response regulator [Xanthobacteraceae bacterium]|nr:response regulator [Xanthobacteraceae bacterium]